MQTSLNGLSEAALSVTCCTEKSYHCNLLHGTLFEVFDSLCKRALHVQPMRHGRPQTPRVRPIRCLHLPMGRDKPQNCTGTDPVDSFAHPQPTEARGSGRRHAVFPGVPHASLGVSRARPPRWAPSGHKATHTPCCGVAVRPLAALPKAKSKGVPVHTWQGSANHGGQKKWECSEDPQESDSSERAGTTGGGKAEAGAEAGPHVELIPTSPSIKLAGARSYCRCSFHRQLQRTPDEILLTH